MTLQQLEDALVSVGFPVTYSHFTDRAPSIPYIAYRVENSENFAADDLVYGRARRGAVELYTRQKDEAAEEAVETALASLGLYFESYESYIDDEELFQISYAVAF